MNFDLDKFADKIIELSATYAPKILLAIVVLFVGFAIATRLAKMIGKIMQKRNIDKDVQPFITSLVGVLTKVMVLISVAGILGIETSSFVAIIAAAGFAIGMALQGSLGNFAGGVLILVFKPFRVGDMIEAQGHVGVVESIQVFNTILVTPQNQVIIIPNGPLSNGSVKNFTAKDKIRVDLTFGIGYDDDIDKARGILQRLLDDCPTRMQGEATNVAVSELADSSVNFFTFLWCKPEDKWATTFHMQEHVKKEFDKAGIGIPYPQMDVHVNQVKG